MSKHQEKQEKPKRPANAFMLFRSERYAQLKKEGDNMKRNEINQLISKEWKELDDKKKSKFEDQYQAAKKKFDIEIDEWNSSHGQDDDEEKEEKKNKKQAASKKAEKEKSVPKSPEKKQAKKGKKNC